MSANVDQAAVEVVRSATANTGIADMTWTEQADLLTNTGAIEVDSTALAGLIRALRATAALP